MSPRNRRILFSLALLIWTATKDRDLLPLSVVAFALAGVGAGVSAIVAFSRHTVLTPAGAERAEYLLGVREFIRVAEADRLRMLQSAAGAERMAASSFSSIRSWVPQVRIRMSATSPMPRPSKRHGVPVRCSR